MKIQNTRRIQKENRKEVFEVIIVENFAKLRTNPKPQIQEFQRTPSRINKITTPRYITFQLQKAKDQEKSFFFFFFGLFAFSRATSVAYGGSQARGLIRDVATGPCQSHSNTRSERHTAHGNARSLTH